MLPTVLFQLTMIGFISLIVLFLDKLFPIKYNPKKKPKKI